MRAVYQLHWHVLARRNHILRERLLEHQRGRFFAAFPFERHESRMDQRFL